MKAKPPAEPNATQFDVVALLNDVPARSLVRGQVGTIVDRLDAKTVLVEFNDDQGRGYAIEPCSETDLLVLHYTPEKPHQHAAE